MGIQGREVKQGHAVYDKAGQMLGGQTVAQPHGQIERLLVVHGFECSTHTQQYTISDGGTASLRQTARERCGVNPCRLCMLSDVLATRGFPNSKEKDH